VIILDASQLITTLTLKDFSSLTGDRNNLGVSNCCNGSWHVRAGRGPLIPTIGCGYVVGLKTVR
jgi:hypothetical protein